MVVPCQPQVVFLLSRVLNDDINEGTIFVWLYRNFNYTADYSCVYCHEHAGGKVVRQQ
ncbi:MAG: hypothetical protein ACJA0E_000673 [Bermanella sp.]|jgi:hypothetical protein